MDKYLLTIGLLLITSSLLSQNVVLDIYKSKLADFIKNEQDSGNERLKNESDYISAEGIAQPILFKHKENTLPDLVTYYFFFQKDSLISSILYEWDYKNSTTYNETTVISQQQETAFINKYNELFNDVFKNYKESRSEGDLNHTSNIKNEGIHKRDIWETKDSTEIELYIDLSSKYLKTEAITIKPTYRIRLYIRNFKQTNNDKSSFLNESIVMKADSVFKTFMSDLKNDNFDQAKSHLSDLLGKTISNTQLVSLKQNIRIEDSLVLFLAGTQFGFDGSINLLIQYRYKKDKNNPPIELIKVLFEKNNKISGIQPVKRQ